MTGRSTIALITDFGLDDNYVGIIKGIIACINPEARIIDITHNVPPFNVDAARYLLETAWRDFPAGTIYLAIVDPGVGTRRKSIIVETDNYHFVGPDNGLFSFLERRSIRRIISVTNRQYFLSRVSATFHGRDIFAPTAAFLSLGVAPDQFGKEQADRYIRRPPFKRKSGRKLLGRTIYIDHFGNLVTSLRAEHLPRGRFLVYLGDKKVGRLRKTFGSVRPGRPVAYINSFGYLEIAISQDSAADFFKVDYGRPADILIAPD